MALRLQHQCVPLRPQLRGGLLDLALETGRPGVSMGSSIDIIQMRRLEPVERE